MERNYRNFTPDFVARKSVFCFGNRLICLGTGIKNSNKDYPTETTLFQSVFRNGMSVSLGEHEIQEVGTTLEASGDTLHPLFLKDGYDNYYWVKRGRVKVRIAEQESRHDKTKEVTHGVFASAWIDHGSAPENADYEYMIEIQPDEQDLKRALANDTYEVMLRNDSIHAVRDLLTGIMAYAAFESVRLPDDKLFLHIPAETMVMCKENDGAIQISVCDPNLNISAKTYTTKEPSRIIVKHILLKGIWNADVKGKVTTEYLGGNTLLTVICQHGQPVEFRLYP